MYRGKVTQVDSSGVWVTTADYGLLGPCQAVVANYTAGDMVLCVNVGDEVAPDLVVVGRLTTKGNVTTGATTDNAIARFDGTAGALQNSGVTVDDSNNISATNASGSHTLYMQGTGNNSLIHRRASGASANYVYEILQSRWGQSDQNQAEWGLSYDGSLYLKQSYVGGSYVNRDIWNIRPDGKFRFSYVGASGGLEFGSGGPRIMAGTGNPEGVVSAPVGSLWLRTNGGASTTLYVKESGTGNTGWVAK